MRNSVDRSVAGVTKESDVTWEKERRDREEARGKVFFCYVTHGAIRGATLPAHLRRLSFFLTAPHPQNTLPLTPPFSFHARDE